MMMIRFTTMARTGRRMKRSVSFMILSPVGGMRIELRRRLHVVLDDDAGAVPQLECTVDRHFLAGLHAVDDGDEIAAGFPDTNELLAHGLGRLAVRPGSGAFLVL